MSKVKRFSTIHDLSDFIFPQDKPDFIDILKSSSSQLSQARTIRLSLNCLYDLYFVSVTITSERTGIVFALNVNDDTITSNKLNDVQEQIDLALHQTNNVQWEFDDIQEDTDPLVFDQISFNTLHFMLSAIKYNTISDYQDSINKAFRDCLDKGIPINIEVPFMSDQFRWLLLRGGFSTAQNHIFCVCFRHDGAYDS